MTNETATIASSGFKVFLPISQWAGRKKDKKASQEVTDANNAKAGVASVNKSLLGDCPELAAISTLVGHVRNDYLYVYTRVWDDAGWRYLPTQFVFDFFRDVTELQNEFFRLVDVFIENYADAKATAIMELGDMFHPEDYPSEDELREKFKFKIRKEPIANSGDWQVDLQNEQMDELRADFDRDKAEQVNNVMTDVWKQLYKSLTKLSERLDYADHEKKKIFNASTVDKLTDLVDLLDAFNVTDDPVMSDMRKNLSDAMRGVTPEALREDGGLRAETKTALDEAIKNLPSLM